VVLNKVVVGRGFSFQPGGHSKSFWERLKTAWHQLRHLGDYQPQRLKLATPSSEHGFEISSIGVVVTPHVLGSNLSRQLLPESVVNDGMLYSLVVAPNSILEMVKFLITESLSTNVTQPGFLGILRSQAVTVKGNQPVEYRHDEQLKTEEALSLRCEADYVTLRVPTASAFIDNTTRSKEIRRTQHLHTSKEAINATVSKPLPWLTHAATEDFRELYQQLRESAQASSTFVIFMILSTLLASFGLYANSAPVIIGAMILAPLMAPIVSLAMAFTRQDEVLLLASGKTLVLGFLLAIGCATLLSLLLPLQIETTEIAARLRPTLLDLGVAIISGIAGAYANARSNAAKSLAGVAIAVALVPPLAVVGIGLGWLSWTVAGGALLLFLTNLAGIVFAASTTFILLGYAPFSRARKGMVSALVAVAVVSIPLAISFTGLAREAAIVVQIEQLDSDVIEIRKVKVLNASDDVRIYLDVVSNGLFDDVKVRKLKADIESALDSEIELEVNWITRY
jgi:uncharacterized hydrophobic protein (TIGR00271 family)